MNTIIDYASRYHLLREKKLKHTMGKVAQQGYMDADDYGTVPLPDGYGFTPVPSNGDFMGYAGWAENFRLFLENHPIYVDKLEVLCGRWRDKLTDYRKVNTEVPLDQRFFPSDKFDYELYQPAISLYGMDTGIGTDAHFASDYRIGLELGFGGFLDKIRKYREIHADDESCREFYDAEEKTVLAIPSWIARHIIEIRRLLSEETVPEFQATLSEMLVANEHVISNPPADFLEACQYIAWFSSVSRIYNRDGAGCKLDQVLLPYYRNDIAAGKLTREHARFILANLLLIDPHYYQLSGCDAEGKDTTNELSWLILEAAHQMNLSANLTVQYHDGIDPEFFRAAVTYNFEDRNGWPRFSGFKGMMNYARNNGVDKQTAIDRIAVGCGWSAVPGRELPMNDLVKVNCARVFEVAYLEMMQNWLEAPHDIHQPEFEPSIERLRAGFVRHLKRAIFALSRCMLFQIEHMHEVEPELVMNLQMYHTLEEGKNISQVAELYTLCVDGVGLGTIADSFAAIEQRVVREKALSWRELYDAIRDNFVHSERIRLMLSSSERYCQGNSLGDAWAKRINEDFVACVRGQAMPEGYQLVPGWFSWSKTIHFGAQVGATPNGRRAFEPLTHGANPTPGFRKDGAPTAMATGIAMIQPNFGNTAPLQIEFDPGLSREEGGIECVMQLIKTHFDMGGTLINLNVLDKKVLMEAHADPSTHPDLIVRVTGFTAYFCTLSPEFRQLVVDRFLDRM